MGKPRVHPNISAHSLKAEFYIIILDSVLWIPFELVWVIGCFAISVCCLWVLFFLQFPHTTDTCTHICVLRDSFLCTLVSFPQEIHFVILPCLFKCKLFHMYINLDRILLFTQKGLGSL